MNKLFFYISFPVSLLGTILGASLTFGFLPNFIEYQRFEKIYNSERGKESNTNNLQHPFYIIFNQNIFFKQNLDEYNKSSDKRAFIQNKLSVVFNKNSINLNTLNQEINNLKNISSQEIKVWEEYKRQNIISTNYPWNIFQTINYLSNIKELSFISASDIGFGFGLFFLTSSLLAFIGFAIFYFSSKRYGIQKDFTNDGIIDTFEERQFNFDEKSINDNEVSATKELIEKISNSNEMKNYLEKNRDIGFKNPILQQKKKENNLFDKQTKNLNNNTTKKNNFFSFKKESNKSNTKDLSKDLLKINKTKKNPLKDKKQSKKEIDRILSGK